MKYLLLLAVVSTCNPTAEECYKLGKHFADIRDFEQAEKHLTKTIEKDSMYLDAYKGRASVYMVQDSFAKAIADYNKIIEMQPLHNPGEWRYLRGTAYYLSLNDSAACADFYNACENFGHTTSCNAYRKICK